MCSRDVFPVMCSRKLGEGNCRICLEENAEQDWDDCLNDHDFSTYKDCYYKYTQLDTFEGENLHVSSTICRSCSDNLKSIDAFVSKAIEIHNLLQISIALKTNKKQEEVFTANFETILVSEADVKPELQNLSMFNESSDENDVWHESKNPNTMEQLDENEIEIIENSSNELENEKKPLKKSKPSEVCCSICSKVLHSKYKAIEHEKIHLENRERNETCNECGMKFYNKSGLRGHMRTHEKNREKTKKCDFCDKAFYESGALKIHRKIHLGQMIKCTICTKQYYRQTDLDKHMLSHSTSKLNAEVKPQKKYFVCCEFCGEDVRSVYYKSHVAKHNNEPLAKCAICNKEFFSRKNCVKHLKVVHRKGRGERSKCVIAYETNRYSNLFLQQNAVKLFIKE